jgi:hypothetical protein
MADKLLEDDFFAPFSAEKSKQATIIRMNGARSHSGKSSSDTGSKSNGDDFTAKKLPRI